LPGGLDAACSPLAELRDSPNRLTVRRESTNAPTSGHLFYLNAIYLGFDITVTSCLSFGALCPAQASDSAAYQAAACFDLLSFETTKPSTIESPSANKIITDMPELSKRLRS
jgi:hypothetical protein